MLDGKKGQNAGENKQTNKTPQLCVGGGCEFTFLCTELARTIFTLQKSPICVCPLRTQLGPL